MATAHVPTQSQQVLIPDDSNIDQSQPVTDPNSLNPQAKKKLLIIGIISCIIVIVVVIIALSIGYQHITSPNSESPARWGWGGESGGCGCSLWNSTFSPFNAVCGNKTKPLTENECPRECMSLYDDYYIDSIYYVRNTSQCYCYTSEMHYQVIINSTNFDQYCVNGTTLDVRQWSYACCVYGRPYFIDSMALQSNITYIDCKKYIYYDNDQWRHFIINNSQSDYEMTYKWKQQALSEYASIATFSKFSLELMSIGAPLWFIELSNQASLDEIRHAQISFDIANMYLNSDQCMISDIFPQHVIDIGADWNRISKDVAVGGCFGELVSAFTMVRNKYDNIIDEYIYQMAMDEIKHSALAWITVKWMIDNYEDNVECIDVGNVNWWNVQIMDAKESMKQSNDEGLYVYDVVIPSIVNYLWMNYGYEELYRLIIDQMSSHLNQQFTSSCVV